MSIKQEAYQTTIKGSDTDYRLHRYDKWFGRITDTKEKTKGVLESQINQSGQETWLNHRSQNKKLTSAWKNQRSHSHDKTCGRTTGYKVRTKHVLEPQITQI